MEQRNVLVAGGAGYIGSHVCVELLSEGHNVLVVDNFDNSHPKALERIEEIASAADQPGTLAHIELDMANAANNPALISAAKDFSVDSAVHLAGLKAVGESVADPARYYNININSALNLVETLKNVGGTRIVFSSSATVYGDLNQSPVDERGNTGPTNPYGQTKFMIEQILRDLCVSGPEWGVVNLRYFNPVGAHPSGRIGEDPNGIPNNLFPFIAQVAVGRREKLSVFGDDYPTPDGTGVRDYLHVVDLAKGHVAALNYLFGDKGAGAHDINLGTGAGVSVKEAIAAFKRASNRDIPFEVTPRRPGDVAEIYANPEKAKAELGWSADKTLEQMCADHWRWQSDNPQGYKDE